MASWASLLLVPTLCAAVTQTGTADTLDASHRAPGPGVAQKPFADKICAAPSLGPALAVKPRAPKAEELSSDQMEAARRIAAAGQRQKVPARAQAIALMAAWSTSDFAPKDDRFLFSDPIPGAEGDADGGMTAAEFYASLLEVKEWQALPPGIAAHRAVGDPDPYGHDAFWDASVTLLGTLASDSLIDPASAVSTGADSPKRCAQASPDGIGLPLPAGTSYRLAPRAGRKAAADPSDLGRDGAEFPAWCGTPVLATIPGTAVLEREAGSAAGPWRLGIRNKAAGVTVWYHHVMTPSVSDGQTVGAGSPVASVGDFGSRDGCSLGVAVWERPSEKPGKAGKSGQPGRSDKKAGKSKSASGKKGKKGKKNASSESKPERPVDTTAWLRTHATPDAVLVPPVRKKKPKKARKKPIPETSFRVASYNVLGAHLTGRGGSKSHFGPGADRMRGGVNLLESSEVDIVALNEFEGPQAAVFDADPDWDMVRATGNSSLRSGDVNGNAIAWRSDHWQLVSVEDEVVVAWQVTLHMPVVRLRNTETGRQVLVMAIHNPASTRRQGNQQGARDAARNTELTAVRSLTEELDLPIIVMGDMNERDAVFCDFTGRGGLVAAAGGSTGGSCRPPDYGGVDWIFGSPSLVFSHFVVDRSTLGGISDHALVSSTVTIPGS